MWRLQGHAHVHQPHDVGKLVDEQVGLHPYAAQALPVALYDAAEHYYRGVVVGECRSVLDVGVAIGHKHIHRYGIAAGIGGAAQALGGHHLLQRGRVKRYVYLPLAQAHTIRLVAAALQEGDEAILGLALQPAARHVLHLYVYGGILVAAQHIRPRFAGILEVVGRWATVHMMPVAAAISNSCAKQHQCSK